MLEDLKEMLHGIPLTSNDTILDTINYERNYAYRLGGGVSDSNSSEAAAFQSYMAFPNVSDYLKACNNLDIIYNIRTTQTNQSIFYNNSWLASTSEQWTLNAKKDDGILSAENDFWVLDYVSGNEIVSNTNYLGKQYRPVFYLKSDTILSGTGTTSDPFTVQEDWTWFDNAQILQ